MGLIRRRRPVDSAGQPKVKRRALPEAGFYPDSATVPFDDPVRNSQPHAGSRICLVMNAPENPENAIAMPGIDSNAVISNGKQPVVFLWGRGNMDLGPALRSELDGVFDQAGEDVFDLVRIAVQFGEGIVAHRGIILVDLLLVGGQCAGQDEVGVEMPVSLMLTNDLRIGSQPGQQFLQSVRGVLQESKESFSLVVQTAPIPPYD